MRILLLATLALLHACATSPTGRSQLMLVSEEDAIKTSEPAYLAQMKEFESEGKLVHDPQVLERIDRITGRLIAQAIIMYPKTSDWKWSVEVVDEPDTVNAWCMAGGRMAIYTGLLEKIEPTDDELAQVMGHEISHALANHTAERMSIARAQLATAFIVGIVADRPAAGIATYGAAQLAITLPNSRTSESEADRIGIELAAKAGYDPAAAPSLWKKMESVGGSGPPAFLSTHPSPGNRQETLAGLVPQMEPYYRAATEPPSYSVKRTELTPGG